MASKNISAPQPLWAKKAEPNGWDFEELKGSEEPIPESWFFVPWSRTTLCDEKTTIELGPNEEFAKLLYFWVKPLEDRYRGSGIVIEMSNLEIIGCYKVHADTDGGSNDKVEYIKQKSGLHRDLVWSDQAAILKIPAKRRTEEQRNELTKLQNELKSMPDSIRRLAGLLLDCRPRYIALHKEILAKVHPVMHSRGDLAMFGARYLFLENEIWSAMDSSFTIQDLPLWRQKQVESPTDPVGK